MYIHFHVWQSFVLKYILCILRQQLSILLVDNDYSIQLNSKIFKQAHISIFASLGVLIRTAPHEGSREAVRNVREKRCGSGTLRLINLLECYSLIEKKTTIEYQVVKDLLNSKTEKYPPCKTRCLIAHLSKNEPYLCSNMFYGTCV